MTDDVPESTEALIEGIRREAADLSAHRLDEQLAVAVARRDVAAAHRLHERAETWQEVALALDEVRRTRAHVAREIEDLTGPPPPVMRRLTQAEMADVHFEDEPPC